MMTNSLLKFSKRSFGPAMRRVAMVFMLALTFGASAIANAQSISGTVTNQTTGKPAAGADVALVDAMQGMAEVGSAKTDAQGKFTLNVASAAQGPRLVRVSHMGVNYFKMVPPGVTTVDAQIYDAAKSVQGITGTVNVMRVQADEKTMHVIELYAVRNQSNPPTTLAADNTFEIAIPPGAKLEGADAQGPNGQPIQVTPTPTKDNRYAFNYALKPGETRFQITYHLPYTGQATLTPRLLRDYEHFVVVLPSGMKWTPKDQNLFRTMPDDPGSNVQVTTSAKAGQDLAFTVAGTGVFPAEPSEQGQAEGGMGGARASNGPGGGLGAPIDAPDALDKYRWPILGLLGVVLAAGAFYTVSKTNAERPVQVAVAAAPSPNAITAAPTGNPLLAAIKDELFQLEIERQQGQISPEEYDKAKAALNQTLSRALARNSRGQGA